MKLKKKHGLFPPETTDWRKVKDRGHMIVLYHRESDTAELIEDEGLSMKVAGLSAEKTELEMMIITWD